MRLLPLKHLPRFRQARNALKILAERESWSREEIETWQLQQINQLWQHASQQVPYYQELANQLAMPPKFDSIPHFQQTVPVISGLSLRGNAKHFLSRQPRPGNWYRTSGSLAIPLRLYRETTAHREILAARYRFYETWGIDMLDKMIQLWGQYSVPPQKLTEWPTYLRQKVLDKIRGRMRLSAYHTHPQQLSRQLEKINRFQPAGIYGFAQSVVLLALEAYRQGFHCPSLKGVILTSELVTSRMMDQVQQAFGVPVTQEFGCTECELIAGLSPEGWMQVREDLVLVETIDRGDGLYRIVFTVLNNPSFPLLRYELADTCDRSLVKPERGFARLSQHCGRANDIIRHRNGHAIYPEEIDRILRHSGCDAPIRRYQVHQLPCGKLDIKFEVFPDRASYLDLQQLTEELQQLTGQLSSITIQPELTTPVAGKHRPFTSE